MQILSHDLSHFFFFLGFSTTTVEGLVVSAGTCPWVLNAQHSKVVRITFFICEILGLRALP